MSRPRRRSSRAKRARWPWLLGAAAGAAAVAYALHRPSPRGPIPVPGETTDVAPPAGREAPAGSGAPSPREEIRKSDREALERVLREHGR